MDKNDNYGVSPRRINADKMFSDGLDKLSPFLRQRFLRGLFKVKKSDMKKLSTLDIENGSIAESDQLKAIIENFEKNQHDRN